MLLLLLAAADQHWCCVFAGRESLQQEACCSAGTHYESCLGITNGSLSLAAAQSSEQHRWYHNQCNRHMSLCQLQGELEGYACKLDGFQRALQELEMQVRARQQHAMPQHRTARMAQTPRVHANAHLEANRASHATRTHHSYKV
jgi:hypothetical protein